MDVNSTKKAFFTVTATLVESYVKSEFEKK